MRIIVTGGGTGGHVFPALEIIKELRKQKQAIDVIWAGNTPSFEERIAEENNIPFFGLKTHKIVGESLLNKIKAGLILIVTVGQCLRFLLAKKPDAVIGVGGYVSAPMVIASFLLGIKRYIAEQNVSPGLANKYLGKIATRIFICFQQSQAYFKPSKCLLTGNPVRQEFFTLSPSPTENHLRILVTGGSMGARSLNIGLPQVLELIKNDSPLIKVTHQTGKNMVHEVAQAYKKAGIIAVVTSFIDDMPKAFSEHDLLVSRAGATVISEITAFGMPSILIPYPFALGHQKLNAEALAKKNAAIILLEGPDLINRLATTIKSLYSDKSKLGSMAEKARGLGGFDAAGTIVRCILKDITKKE